MAPDGCTQYFFGQTTDIVKTYNFSGGQHLASQDQNICVRQLLKLQVLFFFNLIKSIKFRLLDVKGTLAKFVGLQLQMEILKHREVRLILQEQA